MYSKYILLPFLILLTTLHTFAVSDSSGVQVLVSTANDEAVYSMALLDAMTEAQLYASSDDGFSPLAPVSPEVKGKRDSVSAAMAMMDKIGKFADEVPSKVDMLPIGVHKTVANMEWTLMLTNMTVGTQGATISAYLRVVTSEGKTLLLGAEGVKLNSDGGISDMKLVLLGEFAIPMGESYRLVLRGGSLNTNTGLAATPMTYAIVGCQGLKLLNLVGDFELSNKLVIPINPSTLKKETDPKLTVKASFAVSVKTWNDMVVSLTLPSFEVKGLDGVVFNLRNAVLDMSDTRNASAMIFPKGYREKYYAGNSSLWRGVYIEELDVVLPEQFANKTTKLRPRFISKCMIIDQQGVSGVYGIEADILPLDEGSASSWKFSVSSVFIELEANRLTKGGFGGKLVLPVSSKPDAKNTFGYSAIITDKDEYFLTVKLTDTLAFDFLMAHVNLKANSYITLAVYNKPNGDNGQTKKVFRPEAVLTGTLTIAASNSSSGGKMGAGLDFTEMRLMTEAPYFRIKGVQYNGQIKFSNFPVSLDRISISEVELDGKSCIGLKFNLQVSVAQNKVTGGALLMLAAYYDKPEGAEGESTDGNWKFYKVKIYEVNIGAEFSKLKVSGKIIFLEDDPIYGNAFSGSIMIDYAGKFKISSSCMFGAKDFRYWYIDARIDLPTAITVVGPFMLNGFGGGVYSKMAKAPKGSALPYVPDDQTSFGVKALVAYVIAKKEVCKGDIMFEMCFNSTGGVRYIAFYGNAEIIAGAGALGGMVAKLNKLNEATEKATSLTNADKIASGNVQDVAKDTDVGSTPASNIFAYIGIQYNFETSTLEANSEIFINLGVLKGRGPGNRAGWMEVHISPGRWYCYAGTPEDRLGVVLSLAVMKLQTGSYFMVGTEMPTFPDPPYEVVRLLGPELYQAKSNINEVNLKSGSGFAFGVDLSLRADVNFLILYSNMNAGVGGDIMLRQYPDAHCEGSSDPIGMNTWYANGRVYTYFEGELGVNVDLMFIHSKIPILYGGAAAMLEAGGPKPTWVKGYMRVKFNVLDGLVSGDMNMKFSLGDECVIVANSNSPVTFPVISDISPATEAVDVDVFTYPQISFNVGVDQPFQITDEDGSNKLFRVKINTLELKSEGKQLAFTKEWTNRNQTLTLVPENTLPSVKTVELKVNVTFEVFAFNTWKPYTSKGVVPVEEKIVSFKTSAAPDNIPHRNLAYMYPAHEQKNVYRAETNKGYVVLKQWQDYLLDGDTKNNKYLRCTTADGQQSILVTPTFIRADKKIEFDISGIQNKMVYALELVSVPIGTKVATTNTNLKTVKDDEGGQYDVKETQAQEVVKGDGEKILLNTRFGTSRYNTFAEKMNVISASVSNKLVFLFSYDYVNVRTAGYEIFDSSEIFGSPYTNNKPLVDYKSLLTDPYYTQYIHPKIYKDYPYSAVSGVTIKNRDVNEYGMPPAKAMYYDQDYVLDPARMPYVDGLADVYRKDYREIENQLMNQYVRGNFNLINIYPQYFRERFPESPLNNIEQIEFTYQMPGNKKGSTGIINYKR